jgi:hypothetical protein
MGNSSVEHGEVVTVVLTLLQATLLEALTRSPSSAFKIEINVGPPDGKGVRDLGGSFIENRRIRFQPTPK